MGGPQMHIYQLNEAIRKATSYDSNNVELSREDETTERAKKISGLSGVRWRWGRTQVFLIPVFPAGPCRTPRPREDAELSGIFWEEWSQQQPGLRPDSVSVLTQTSSKFFGF